MSNRKSSSNIGSPRPIELELKEVVTDSNSNKVRLNEQYIGNDDMNISSKDDEERTNHDGQHTGVNDYIICNNKEEKDCHEQHYEHCSGGNSGISTRKEVDEERNECHEEYIARANTSVTSLRLFIYRLSWEVRIYFLSIFDCELSARVIQSMRNKNKHKNTGGARDRGDCYVSDFLVDSSRRGGHELFSSHR